MQLKKGDNFIRISKYGYVFGIVKEIFESHSCDYTNYGVMRSVFQIKSTNDVMYDYNECYKVIKFYTKEEIENFAGIYHNIKNLKNGL